MSINETLQKMLAAASMQIDYANAVVSQVKIVYEENAKLREELANVKGESNNGSKAETGPDKEVAEAQA